jgi:hypothetical protein
MGTTITINHPIEFNEAGEALCGYCIGLNKPKNRARIVRVVRLGNSTASLGKDTKDGIRVGFGKALCGTHNRSHSMRNLSMPADHLSGNLITDLMLAVHLYETDQKATAEREAEHEREYRNGLLKVAQMTESQFTITHENLGRGGGRRTVISGPTYNGTQAIRWVDLAVDHGIWAVKSGSYSMHTGKGAGSPALARVEANLMLFAADQAEEANKTDEVERHQVHVSEPMAFGLRRPYDFYCCSICWDILKLANEWMETERDIPDGIEDNDLVDRYLHHAQMMSQS